MLDFGTTPDYNETAKRKREKESAMELWDAYNKNEEKAGVDLIRGEEIPKGLYHLVVSTVVRHKDGTYLLLRRSENKTIAPGFEEIGAGGAVLKGETPLQGAMRELREETGIRAVRMEPLFHLESEAAQCIDYGYLCVTDVPKVSVVLQEGETTGYRWITQEELLAFCDSDACIPIQRVCLEDFRNELRETI